MVDQGLAVPPNDSSWANKETLRLNELELPEATFGPVASFQGCVGFCNVVDKGPQLTL